MIKALKQFYRILHINYVLIKNGLDEIVLSIPIFAPVRFLGYINPWYWVVNRNKPRGERIRNALEQLGPIFVKFGQTLSTRSDILPDDIAVELEKLQDQVPPFPGELAKKIIENAFKQPIEELFVNFDLNPLASASIAQVHTASLPNGKEIIVKVVRPHIEKIIARDVSLLYTLARLAERYWSQGKRLHPVGIVAEFERSIFDELDLLREAANASQLRRNFTNSTMLYIPEIYWNYAKPNVLIMERIYGIPISDIDQLREHQIDLKKLAERGVEIFFTQVFRDCFFHADMHPGNIFVDFYRPNEPRYIAVDFGIIGSLSPRDQRYLAENFVAFFKRDYRRVALLHLESGWIPANTRIDEFESAMRTVCEPFFEKPLKDISFGLMLMRLFQTGKRFQMEVQPQLMLLQKTLLNIEGLGRRLYPELDLWATAKPFLEKWLRKQLGVRAFIKNIRDKMPYYAEVLPELPGILYESLQKVKNDRANPEQNVKMIYVPRNHFWLGIGSAFLISALTNFVLLQQKLVTYQHIGLLIMSFGVVAVIALVINYLKNL